MKGISIISIWAVLSFSASLWAQGGHPARKQAADEPELPRNHVSLVENKMGTLLQMIRYAYVEDVDLAPIVEKGIVNILEQLDPHSAYIAAKDLKRTNEPLVGNFDGIGVRRQRDDHRRDFGRAFPQGRFASG